MKKYRAIGTIILAFVAGSWIGYVSFPARGAVEGEVKEGLAKEKVGDGRRGEVKIGSTSFRAANRTRKSSIRRDLHGNYLLPGALAERFRFMALRDLSVNREELRVVGLDDAKMDRLQNVIDEMLTRWLGRTKLAMQEFTRNQDEVVWKVGADREANTADLTWLKEQLRGIVGQGSPLLEQRLFSEIQYLVMVQNGQDYYLRVAHSRSSPGMLTFESLVLTSKDGNALPQPGEPFTGYEDRYYYSSSQRSGGEPRAEMVPLLEDKDLRDLSQNPPETPLR